MLAAVQNAARRASAQWPAAILDRRCARRPGRAQVGTTGWVLVFMGRRPVSGELRLGWVGGQGPRSWLGFAALAGVLLAAFAGLLEPVGLALDGDDLGGLDEAIDQRDDAGGVGEHLTPFGKGAVGSDQRAAGLVAARDQLEHQVGVEVGLGLSGRGTLLEPGRVGHCGICLPVPTFACRLRIGVTVLLQTPMYIAI